VNLSESPRVPVSALLLALHLTSAALATAAFWAAAIARKGAHAHRVAGRWFARLVYLTAVTGTVMAVWRLLTPIGPIPAGDLTPSLASAVAERQTMWLVLYVMLIIVSPVQHGLAVVAAGDRPARLRSRRHAALSLAAMVTAVALIPSALLWERWAFLIVAPIGLVVGLRQLAYASRPAARQLDWEREHLTSMLTAGITLHTALLVFGATRTLGWSLPGVAGIWPWVVPAAVGLPTILWLRARRSPKQTGANPSSRS
jgi:hypothetical protein